MFTWAISGQGTEYAPVDESSLILGTYFCSKIKECQYACHSNYFCRVFDYDSVSHRCRLFEGNLQTTGSLIISNSSTSTVGEIELYPELFTAYGNSCSACLDSRYLTCVNSTCRCLPRTYWTGSICASQNLRGGQCSDSNQCRIDRNYICLQFFQCGPDQFNHRILLWLWNTSNATVIAGQTGVPGNDTFSLNSPSDVFVDEKLGYMFVADFNNHRIVRYSIGSLNGIVVAGGNGPGTQRNQLFGPIGVYVSKKTGAIYIADQNNNRIQKWIVGDSQGVTIAGSPDGISGTSSLLLNMPNAVALNEEETSFQCLNGNPSDLNTDNLWHERVCMFHNVCLRKDGFNENYFIDYFYPSSIESLKSTIIRNISNKLLSLRHGSRIHHRENLIVARMKLNPINDLNLSEFNRNVTYLDNTYLIYQLLAHQDMNLGHFIFDDVFGLYSNLKQFRSTRFNSPNQNYVVAYETCYRFNEALQDLCYKFTEGIFPVVTSHRILSIDSLLHSSKRICFRQLIAGQGLSGAIGYYPKNLHRAPIFDEFRSDLLRIHGINPDLTPQHHHIVIVKKDGRRKFQNLNEIYTKIQTAPQYSGIKLTILDNFVSMTIADQLKLFQTITIVISPCGGISLLFSFLPRKSTLIVSGFAQPEKNGYRAERMEAVYWDYQSHLNVLHYPVESDDDFQLDSSLKKDDFVDVRNNADIILKTEKLFPLIDRAI
ncbi:unnamed protein product, partial [Adineta steineri]